MDNLPGIIERAEKSNYNMGRINDLEFNSHLGLTISSYFKNGFDQKHFLSLSKKIHDLVLTSQIIRNLSSDDILSIFNLLEKVLWYYNDYLKNNRYKIKNLYVLLSLYFSNLTDRDLKYLTNSYNNIIQEWPVSGAILVSNGHVLLVKNNFSKTWSYPKGKLDRSERPTNAAMRECYEETGYNISGQIDPNQVIIKKYNKKIVYFYVIANVPFDYPFKPQNDNEIVEVQWFPLNQNLLGCRDFNIYVNKSYGDLLKILENSSVYSSS
jgi:mRNA-decapping enzyme subunit 2